MALILNIETATKNCSVALAKDGVCIAVKEENNGNYSHAEKLHVFMDQVFKEQNIQANDLDAIAVGKGPGSYTGLRIGVSAAKGLAYAIDKPLIAIDTLKTLAKNIAIEQGIVVPMLDARRLEVYSAIYNTDDHILRSVEAEIICETSFLSYLNSQKVYFLGDGAHKCKEIITHKNAIFIDDQFPSATKMARLSEEKFHQKTNEDVAYFEPFYLKDFVVTPQKKKKITI